VPTAVGDVVPALVTLATTALAPTVVYHGPKPSSAAPTEYLCVAFNPEGGNGVVTAQVASALGNRWVDESGDVICSLTAWSGGSDTDALLARVDDLLDLLDAALKANPTLGGVLVGGADDGSYARVLGAGAYESTGDTQGVAARLTFTIHYSSLLAG
jgi:hypothetical protein